MRTVPQGPNGFTGLTSCCKGDTTFLGATLCCRACYMPVTAVAIEGRKGLLFEEAVRACSDGDLTGDELLAVQNAFLTGKEKPVAAMGYVISAEEIELQSTPKQANDVI